jgi:hypothetical protein
VNWIILAHGREKWRNVVNTAVNRRFLQNEGIFSTGRRIISVLIRTPSVDLVGFKVAVF